MTSSHEVTAPRGASPASCAAWAGGAVYAGLRDTGASLECGPAALSPVSALCPWTGRLLSTRVAALAQRGQWAARGGGRKGLWVPSTTVTGAAGSKTLSADSAGFPARSRGAREPRLPSECSPSPPSVCWFHRPHGHEEPRQLLLHECGPAGPVQLVGFTSSGSRGGPGSRGNSSCCPQAGSCVLLTEAWMWAHIKTPQTTPAL